MIIAICITLLIVAFLLHISGGDKEHDKLLLELIKQPVNKTIYDRVYFDNNLAIELCSDKSVILKKWMWSAYNQSYIYDSYEKLYPTYNTHRKVKKFIKQQIKESKLIAEQEKTKRLNKITDTLKGV